MDLDEFRLDFRESVLSAAQAASDFIRGAFIDEAARRLVAAEELEDFERCQHEGTGARGRRLRVDGYARDDTDGSFALIIGEWSDSEEPSPLTQTEGTRIFALLRAFVEDALAGRLTDGTIDESTPGYDLADELCRHRSTTTRYRFYLVTDRALSSRVRDWPEDVLGAVPTEFHIWDITRFHRAHESATGRDELVVDFAAEANGGLPSLKASASADYEAYLCVIPGGALADIYDRYGSRLLEGNVRSFLSAKGKVNARIQRTIADEPEMFFAYNNGISATAASVEFSESDGVLRLTKAADLQIVNGGQTTASLAFARRKDSADLSGVFVQMKLSVVAPERAVRLIPDIARYANSQNKVSDADFFANHPFHVRIEEISRRLWAPAVAGSQSQTKWFYERARGQYQNEQAGLTKARKAQFQLQLPRGQVITKTDLAKYENSWNALPHKVSFGAQKNFMTFAETVQKSWEAGSERFNEDFFRRVVAIAILFSHVERLVSKQPWYQGGYRAQVVTYTVARLAREIKESRADTDFDFRKVWDAQAFPEEADPDIAAIAGEAFVVLTSPDAGVGNVTEWAKKEVCWTRLCERPVRLSGWVSKFLLDRLESRTRTKDAEKIQELDAGIQAQSQVVQIPSQEWLKMRRFAESKGLLSPKELQTLSLVATLMPRRVPTEKQSVAALGALRKLLEEGYRAS